MKKSFQPSFHRMANKPPPVFLQIGVLGKDGSERGPAVYLLVAVQVAEKPFQ